MKRPLEPDDAVSKLASEGIIKYTTIICSDNNYTSIMLYALESYYICSTIIMLA